MSHWLYLKEDALYSFGTNANYFKSNYPPEFTNPPKAKGRTHFLTQMKMQITWCIISCSVHPRLLRIVNGPVWGRCRCVFRSTGGSKMASCTLLRIYLLAPRVASALPMRNARNRWDASKVSRSRKLARFKVFMGKVFFIRHTFRLGRSQGRPRGGATRDCTQAQELITEHCIIW